MMNKDTVVIPFEGFKNVMNVLQGHIHVWDIEGKTFQPPEAEIKIMLDNRDSEGTNRDKLKELEYRFIAPTGGTVDTAYVTHRGNWVFLEVDGQSEMLFAALTVSALVVPSIC